MEQSSAFSPTASKLGRYALNVGLFSGSFLTGVTIGFFALTTLPACAVGGTFVVSGITIVDHLETKYFPVPKESPASSPDANGPTQTSEDRNDPLRSQDGSFDPDQSQRDCFETQNPEQATDDFPFYTAGVREEHNAMRADPFQIREGSFEMQGSGQAINDTPFVFIAGVRGERINMRADLGTVRLPPQAHFADDTMRMTPLGASDLEATGTAEGDNASPNGQNVLTTNPKNGEMRVQPHE